MRLKVSRVTIAKTSGIRATQGDELGGLFAGEEYLARKPAWSQSREEPLELNSPAGGGGQLERSSGFDDFRGFSEVNLSKCAADSGEMQVMK